VADVSVIFKAYDVRGLVPSQLDADVCHQIGLAFAEEVRGDGSTAVVIGHDMRASSPQLVEAFADGVRMTGSDVVHIGLAATDQPGSSCAGRARSHSRSRPASAPSGMQSRPLARRRGGRPRPVQGAAERSTCCPTMWPTCTIWSRSPGDG
jgi:hypothetical protein